jgi:formate dehydrogenase subunit gamma
VSGSVERFDEKARATFARHGRTVVRRGELLRHPIYTRVLHWTVAIFFILSLLSGFAIYASWLYRWLTPLFGGGPMTRFLHPWFSLAFTIAFVFQFVNWLRPMRWTPGDRRWMKRIKTYVTNTEKEELRDVGFFNAGQKLYFWLLAFGLIFLLITGILLWFDHVTPRWIVAISYVVHDIAALALLAGFILHVYESTAQQPGTFNSMIDGTVTEDWARSHHPAWFEEVTREDRRDDDVTTERVP